MERAEGASVTDGLHLCGGPAGYSMRAVQSGAVLRDTYLAQNIW